MFYASTNKTEESWTRKGIRRTMPSDNSDEIMDRILKVTNPNMSYETAVDFYRHQLGTWRRFYKQSDEVETEESVTPDQLRVCRIKSMNIVFYVKEKSDNTVDIHASFSFEDEEEMSEL